MSAEKIVWIKNEYGDGYQGFIPGELKTTLYIITEPVAGKFTLSGAFIPNDVEETFRDLDGPLEELQSSAQGFYDRWMRRRENERFVAPPDMGPVKRFLDLAARGRGGSASSGEQRAQKLAAGILPLIDHLWGLDGDAIEGLCTLIRSGSGDADPVKTLLRGVVAKGRRAV